VRVSAALARWRSDAIGGFTTFATLAYILFVNPAILSDPNGAAMDPGAVLAATAVASAAATLLMGFLAGYPIAVAPGMGLNAFFSYTICGTMGFPWQAALAMVFVSGALLALLTFVGLREKVLDAIPRSLQHGTAAGIGLFLAFVGLQQAGWIVGHPATLVHLGDLTRPVPLLAAFGLLATVVLFVRGVPGSLLWGILATGAVGVGSGVVPWRGLVGPPPSLGPTFGALDFRALFVASAAMPIFTLLFFDFLDTLGTLFGVSEQGGFLVEGRLPRARQALFADSVGIMLGGLLGTSALCAYVESAAGVSQGARTWRANVVIAAAFLLALFFSPLFATLGGGIADPATGRILYPVTAPALVVVGSLMAASLRRIPWDDPAEAIPAFVTLSTMPLAYSIADGLALGFVAASIADLARRGGRKLPGWVHGAAVLLALRYALL
jgi:AGZA family xanthine/uracil permease-like MFS transporter